MATIENSDVTASPRFIGHLANVSDDKLRDYVARFRDLSGDPGHVGFAGVADAIADAARRELARRGIS